MTPAEKALVGLIIVLVFVLGWAVIAYVLGLRPTVGLGS